MKTEELEGTDLADTFIIGELKRWSSTMADSCDDDRSEVKDESEVGDRKTEELEGTDLADTFVIGELKRWSTTMANSCNDEWSEVNDETVVGDCKIDTELAIADGNVEDPGSSSQSLLPNCSPCSSPSTPSRASFTELSLQYAPQMNTWISTTRCFQLLFSLVEYIPEVICLHAKHNNINKLATKHTYIHVTLIDTDY